MGRSTPQNAESACREERVPRPGPRSAPDTDAARPAPPTERNNPSKAPGAAASPDGAAKPPDPLAETICLLKGCTRQAELVCYLWERRHGGVTTLNQVATEVFKVTPARLSFRIKNVRTQVGRTRKNLEQKDCPLRLAVAANTVRLVPAASCMQLVTEPPSQRPADSKK